MIAIEMGKRYREVAEWDVDEISVYWAAIEYRNELQKQYQEQERLKASLRASRAGRRQR